MRFWWPAPAILRHGGDESGTKLGICEAACAAFRRSVRTNPAVGLSGGDATPRLDEAAEVVGEVGDAGLRAGSRETDGSDD